jgi:hypothetical protein
MKIRDEERVEVIIPYKLIFKNQLYEILNLSPKFIITNYKIKTVDNKIDTVTLNNPHPNASPRTGEFCIPHKLRSFELNENTLNMIKSMLCCFNLDDCYFTPWNEIEYEKQEVNGAWKTKQT